MASSRRRLVSIRSSRHLTPMNAAPFVLRTDREGYLLDLDERASGFLNVGRRRTAALRMTSLILENRSDLLMDLLSIRTGEVRTRDVLLKPRGRRPWVASLSLEGRDAAIVWTVRVLEEKSSSHVRRGVS